MNKPEKPAQLESVKTLCEGKDDCVIYGKREFGVYDCPGKIDAHSL